MNSEGVAIPSASDPAKEDPKVLLKQIGELNRTLLSERQAAAQALANEKFKQQAEMTKLRQSTSQHRSDLENQNSALLQSLGRLKEENDQLKKEILTMQLRTAQADTPRVQAEPASTVAVAVVPHSPSLGGEAIPAKLGQ